MVIGVRGEQVVLQEPLEKVLREQAFTKGGSPEHRCGSSGLYRSVQEWISAQAPGWQGATIENTGSI